MKQEPLVNIGDLVWVKIQLGRDHYTSLTAFVFAVNYWDGQNVSSYYAEYLEQNNPQTTALYGFDFNDIWGKLET